MPFAAHFEPFRGNSMQVPVYQPSAQINESFQSCLIVPNQGIF
jgi:hypothetical protein